jgi:hypothetical protein
MWHEARRSERKVHDLMDAARRRAQRRAAYLARRRGDPQQALQVSGTRCRVHRDDALYQATEDQQGLCVPRPLSPSLSFSRCWCDAWSQPRHCSGFGLMGYPVRVESLL